MEQRLLLVFALTFIVILISQPQLKKFFPAAPEPPPTKTWPQASPAPAPANVSQLPAQTQAPASGISKQAAAETEIVVENDFYRIAFTNRGAQVKSWILKKYDDDLGNPLELVNTVASEKYGYPLSLWTYDETQRNRLTSALYVSSSVGPLSAPGELTFEYADQDLAVRKTFHFDQTYVIGLETSVRAKGSVVAAYPMWPAGFGDQTTPGARGAQKAYGRTSSYTSQLGYQYNGDTERIDIKKVSGGGTLHGPFQWAGVSDQYFAAVFLPEDPQNAAAVTLRNPLDVPKDAQNPSSQETIKVDVLGIAVGDPRGQTTQRLYVGPKSLQVLESVAVPGIAGADPDLRTLVNFGFFGIIARPLFIWLRLTHDFVHNWGWAIALQTLIINLVLLPLRISSMKSALKMQKIQPQMNAIKEKYKKYTMRDPRRQEMNTEIGELMKREGVSPVGGCLPLVIQMPFLFAYYGMLGAALDLRHAHWLWIHDLSSADPWHILPIGIIITMLFTQRMTPQAGMDPSQQKMMNLMMPVMLGVISWNLAAGLCLYWSEGNLIAMAQQTIMNRTSLGREMREMALKRARKKEK